MEERLKITMREARYNIDTLRNETPPGFKASAKLGTGNRIKIHLFDTGRQGKRYMKYSSILPLKFSLQKFQVFYIAESTLINDETIESLIYSLQEILKELRTFGRFKIRSKLMNFYLRVKLCFIKQ